MTTRDIGALLAPRGCAGASATAGGSGDATEKNGQWLDRQGYLSATLVVFYDATLAQDETLSIAANLQDADDDQGNGGGDFGDAIANAVVATGGAGGSNEIGVVRKDFDLSAAKQYVRAQFTPDLSAGTTDTAILGAVLILGGADEIPTA